MSRIKVYFALESQRDKKATLVVSGQSTIADAMEKLHHQNIVRDIFKEQCVDFVGLLPRSDLALPEESYKRDLAIASTCHPIEDCVSQDDIILLRAQPAAPVAALAAAAAQEPFVIDLLSSSDEEDQNEEKKGHKCDTDDDARDHSDDSSYNDEDPNSATVRSAWTSSGKKKKSRTNISLEKAPERKAPAQKKKKKRTVKDTSNAFQEREKILKRKRLASQRKKKEVDMYGDRIPNDGVPRCISVLNASPFGKAPPGRLIPEEDRFDRRIYFCQTNETPADVARKYLICRPNPAGRILYDNRAKHHSQLHRNCYANEGRRYSSAPTYYIGEKWTLSQ
mmetsp:Transcript_14642/g.42128  ORF Transcript_14642/g.42128 Transcript_14642/m.42128 type:complete len:337 (-) Transcript_14642:80-1090(-)